MGVCDVEEPTASPMFPRDLATLVSLGPEEARKLVREYGLIGEDEDEGDVDEEVQVAAVRTPTGRTRRDPRPTSTFTTASDGQSWVNAGLQGSREEDINRFMRFIGVSVSFVFARWAGFRATSRLCPTFPDVTSAEPMFAHIYFLCLH